MTVIKAVMAVSRMATDYGIPVDSGTLENVFWHVHNHCLAHSDGNVLECPYVLATIRMAVACHNCCEFGSVIAGHSHEHCGICDVGIPHYACEDCKGM